MKKIVILLLVAPPVLLAAVFGYVLFKGPRMTVQHHFRDYQRVAPPPPPGTVSVGHVAPPSATERAALKNPLQPTAANLAAGGIYYQYYCVFCHGETGAGNGPVGQSYTPVPTDLRLAKIRSYGDGDLLRRMLTGIGHEPVLARVVPQEHRWHLALYVRSLAQVR